MPAEELQEPGVDLVGEAEVDVVLPLRVDPELGPVRRGVFEESRAEETGRQGQSLWYRG